MSIVLIVDDVQTDRQLVGSVVSAAGHHVEYANNGDEAIAKAASHQPSLIFMDVVMPNKDGFATCRAIKKNDGTATIPIVLVTSKNTPADKFWASKQGADGYITKPFSPSEIKDMLGKFLA